MSVIAQLSVSSKWASECVELAGLFPQLDVPEPTFNVNCKHFSISSMVGSGK